MDIAMVSMALSHNQIMTNIGTAVLAQTLDTIEVGSDSLLKMMEQSVNPNIGQNVDIKL